jgi:integrase
MGRRGKNGPWWWAARSTWAANIGGKRVVLGADKREAVRTYRKLVHEPVARQGAAQVVDLLDAFLKWCKIHRPDSLSWYFTRISEFSKRIGKLQVSELKPFHVQEWIDSKKVSDGHKRGCLVAVSRGLNWAVKQGYIDRSPLRGMEKPKAGQREKVVSQAEFDQIVGLASDQNFKDVLIFCWDTGCRPQEVVKLEAKHLDLKNDRCVLSAKEAKGKKRKRVIYLTARPREILARLGSLYPDGKLFRTRRKKGWTANNIACRFQRMESKLGWLPCLYNIRHTYCNRALINGVDPIALADLMGHADASMIMKVYQHIHQDSDHLRKAAQRAVL